MSAVVIALPGLAPCPDPRPSAEQRDRALHAELRRARIHIARLERSLDAALRDAMTNRERARAAEARLSELTRPRPVPPA